MMFKYWALLSVLLVPGCATTHYTIFTIPDTPDGLAGYRQCMATEKVGNMPACMAGIDGFLNNTYEAVYDTYTAQSNPPPQFNSIDPACRVLWSDVFSRGNDTYEYKIQACKEGGQ
jgi:hypothetical protein